MRIVIAPAAYKGTVSASDAAIAIAARLSDHPCVLMPMADGGDGTLDVLLAHGFAPMSVGCVDAIGRPRTARIGMRGREAVIELAEICGIAHLDHLAPMTASSRGVGMAIGAALDAGAREITLAIGGSASTDAGTGMLSALGMRFLDSDGDAVPDGLHGLASIAKVDATDLDPRIASADIRVLLDVDAPLTGPKGAAYAFGPQKGVVDLAAADAALAHVAALIDADAAELPGAGAAGGVGFAALVVLGAQPVRGADALAELIGLDDVMADADLVITGEGRFDATTLVGKAPARVIAAARGAGVPVAVIAGSIEEGTLPPDVLGQALEPGGSPADQLARAAAAIVSKVAG